ncbi:hypothetical protein LV779_11415 [Streptomyces thinghirensis]|nr:hypothetical protein [Streptomyces thinghirensis]
MTDNGSSPGANGRPGPVFHSRYVPLAQPRTRGPPAEPEEPGVRRDLRPLRPPRRTAADRLPPAGRQLTAQHHAPGRTDLDRAVPGRRLPSPARPPPRQPPSLSGSSTARGSGSGQRPANAYDGSRPGSVPAPEHCPVHGDEDAQLRTAEPDDTAPGPLAPPPASDPAPAHACAPRGGSPAASGLPPAPRRPYGTQPPAPPPQNRPPSSNAPGHDRPCCSPCHRPPPARASFNCRSPVTGPHLHDSDYVGRALV